MSGYVPSIPVQTQITNLTEQIPPIHRTNVLAMAITDGNEYDFCGRLTGLVLGKVWTSFGEHAICEADELEVVENNNTLDAILETIDDPRYDANWEQHCNETLSTRESDYPR